LQQFASVAVDKYPKNRLSAPDSKPAGELRRSSLNHFQRGFWEYKVGISLAREERDYLRKVAKTAANARENAIKSGLGKYLHSGSDAMKLFNAEFKQRRLAGQITLRYSVAKARFEKLLAERLIDGPRSGDLKAAIEAALS